MWRRAADVGIGVCLAVFLFAFAVVWWRASRGAPETPFVRAAAWCGVASMPPLVLLLWVRMFGWFAGHLGRMRETARRGRGLCPRCGHDLRATPGKCPECGAGGAVHPRDPRR